MKWLANALEKLNPVQPVIHRNEGDTVPTSQIRSNSVANAYKYIEPVNRGVNLLADMFSMVDYDVKEKLPFTGNTNLKSNTIHKLLNYRPNPYQDVSTFRRHIIMDLLLTGDAFIYCDGANLFHWPSKSVEIVTDKVTLVGGYKFDSNPKVFSPDSVMHIKDNGVDSLYRGWSRITSALDSLSNRENMMDYQKTFFDNGMAPGLIFTTEQALGVNIKNRMRDSWAKEYNPKSGAKRPMILDGGLKPHAMTGEDFSKMEFNDSIQSFEDKALMALGIPPILLNSGNNANIRPNVELMFNLTIIPMVRKFISAFEAFFAYDIKETTHEIAALAPDAKAQSDRLTALVNNGIMLGAEARAELRLEAIDDENLDKIRIPANVAGSATNITGQEGGRPEEDGDPE